jgi:CPA1 family monovalent cation:H+ antiporter
MLCFLLFAGALHIDWADMRKGRWPILLLSTVGTLLSTVIVAFGFRLLSGLIGFEVPITWCFVVGALISPTDPVAVMAVLKHVAVPKTLSATISAESLFNDGIGVVLFGIALSIAVEGHGVTVAGAAWDFVREAGGGIVLGVAAGGLGYLLMRGVDDYNVEVMITLAVVMGGYALAHVLGVSGPVAMAVAGLIVGNTAVSHAMSDTTRDYLLKFWSLIDELLNAVLFLLIGLEFIAVARSGPLVLLTAMTIPLALAARWLSVVGPLLVLRPFINLGRTALPVLVWGGLRGGLSVAMALSLTSGPARDIILVATYGVVLFAVLIQGGTIGGVVSRLNAKSDIPHQA